MAVEVYQHLLWEVSKLIKRANLGLISTIDKKLEEIGWHLCATVPDRKPKKTKLDNERRESMDIYVAGLSSLHSDHKTSHMIKKTKINRLQMRVDNFWVCEGLFYNSSHLFMSDFEKNKKDKSVQNEELICRPWFYSLCPSVGTEDKKSGIWPRALGPPHSHRFSVSFS